MSAPAGLVRLIAHRCFNHADREAAARCVSCGRYHCRECVAEHSGRMICGACLRKEAAATPKRDTRRWFAAAGRALHLGAALVIAWLVFYTAGRFLVSMPTEFHEGTVWEAK